MTKCSSYLQGIDETGLFGSKSVVITEAVCPNFVVECESYPCCCVFLHEKEYLLTGKGGNFLGKEHLERYLCFN